MYAESAGCGFCKAQHRRLFENRDYGFCNVYMLYSAVFYHLAFWCVQNHLEGFSEGCGTDYYRSGAGISAESDYEMGAGLLYEASGKAHKGGA